MLDAVQIVELTDAAFDKALICSHTWYKRWIRGFVIEHTVYLKKSARFLFPHSKEDLVLHEIGHMLGYKHRWLGTMAWHGLFRM